MRRDAAFVRIGNGCKINLGLRLTGLRPDGYHELDSVFYPLPYPRDTLTIRRTNGEGIKVLHTPPGIDPADNTIVKANAVFVQAAGVSLGLEVSLRKRIPVGAGLGGGSGNAAALLRWLNEECGRPLSEDALAAAALKIGADTPFFLLNSPCRVRGIGELLTPLSAGLAGWRLVLACPDIQVSTRQAYLRFDTMFPALKSALGPYDLTNSVSGDKKSALFDRLQGACSCGNLTNALINDLEAVVFPEFPFLASIKADFLALGANAAGMSGSGSSLFGLFSPDRGEAARKAVLRLRSSELRHVFLLRL